MRSPTPDCSPSAPKKPGFLPKNACLWGDSLKGDVLGAENAGMRALWYAPEQSQFQLHPGFSHYSQLKKPIDMV